MGSRRGRWPATGCAVVLMTLCAVATPMARGADAVHPSIGSLVDPPIAVAGPLMDACGVAVDATGRTFVSNYYGHAVYIYGDNRQFEARVTVHEPPLAPTGKPYGGPCDLAFDAGGDLYVNNWHANVIRFPRFGATSFGPAEAISPGPATGISVDPASGDLYIDARTHVDVYEAPISSGDEPVEVGGGAIGDGYGIAVSRFPGAPGFPSTAGRIYVADAASGTIKVFDPDEPAPQSPVQTIDGGGTPRLGFTNLIDTDVAVDPGDGHVYVVDNLEPGFEEPEAVVDEFSSLGHYRGPIPHGVANGERSTLVHAGPSGLALDADNVYVTSGNYFNDNTTYRSSEVRIYGPAPAITTEILSVAKSGLGDGAVTSNPAALGCGGACAEEFEGGSTVVLSAIPAARSRFVGWAGCDSELGGRCVVTMVGPRTVGAEFEPAPQRTLSVHVVGGGLVSSAPAGIECDGNCAASFNDGTEVTLSALPVSGNRLSAWSGCDSEPSPGKCKVAMKAARSVNATFVPVLGPSPLPPPPVQRILSVATTATGSATGSVSSESGGIDCGTTCAALFASGDSVTLVAHPEPGSSFLGWGGCDDADSRRCTVTMGADRQVAAAFGAGYPGPLKVSKSVVQGRSAVLTVVVPAAGELRAGGANLRPISALPVAAGTVRLLLRLTASGSRKLIRAKRRGGRLRVRAGLLFAPFDGGTTVRANRSIAFGPLRHHRRGGGPK